MFQHMVLSPKKIEIKQESKSKQAPPEEIEVLSLAPFTSTPKLSFDNVKLGTIVTKTIIIRNPTPTDIKLYILKKPPHERNVSFNWTEILIQAACDELLEITWHPLVAGGWRDVVHITDNGRIKRDVYIAFICIKPQTKQKKFGVKVKPKISPKKKSPLKKSANTSRPVLKSNTIVSQISLPSPTRRATFKVSNKENLPKSLTTNRSNSTYTISPMKTKSEAIKIQENFDDSLESSSINQNMSPCNNINHFANIPYTPLVASKDKNFLLSPETPLTKRPSFTCSTGEISINQKEQSSRGNCSAETYIKSNLDLSGGTYVKENISGGTYVKGNISGGTYVKANANLSGDTYVKANLSGGTYVKDNSIGNLADLQMSPLGHHVSPSLSTLDFSPISITPLQNKYDKLGKISEESSFEGTPKKKSKTLAPKTLPIKTNTTYDISPGVRKQNSLFTKKISSDLEVECSRNTKKISPVKRLSKAYMKKPLHLVKFIQNAKSPSGINLINSSAVATTSTHNPDLFYNNVCNPYILAETNGVDPFMAATMYYDPQWMDEQINRFKNWLNVLLIPPEHLDCRTVKIDFGKLWQECRNKDVEKAPSKEQVSSKYNDSHLQLLRRNATKLMRSKEMIIVLSKCNGMIENNKITMRSDKCLHQDIGLQKEILRLFFCYNPLWLRIGLETVFSLHIHLRSNSDVIGLSSFLIKNFFNNQYLLKKYKHKTVPQYGTEVKKEATKKFLSLIYFLDQAKEKQLLPYDPCLFMKTAPIKESKEILLRFSSELFSSIGDVTKPLKIMDYILVHKQTYIHEYEYGVENLGSDLKDGVRLTRVMEIILLEPNITNKCRVPAISRLQKIHNVKLAFDALKQANYVIEGNIEPKDIVEGHREKTLSFLWQIIYKFQSPRYTKAIITVQTWWRSAQIQEKLEFLRSQRLLRYNSAIVIQKWFRRYCLRMKLEALIPQIRLILNEIKRTNAAIKIQAVIRMFSCRRKYLRLYESTLVIQKHFRLWYLNSYLRKKRHAAAIVIQRFWRSVSLRQQFLRMKQAVSVISDFYTAIKQRRECQYYYSSLRRACIFVQGKFRALKVMRLIRNEYLQMQKACVVIQTKYLANKLMKIERSKFLHKKNAAILIQRGFRARKQMKIEYIAYARLRNAIICIQRHFKATIAMKKQRKQFVMVKESVIKIQIWYRSLLAMRKDRNNYEKLHEAVVCIQRKYKATKIMKIQRMEYLQLKENVVKVQRRYQANKAMKIQRNEYGNLKQAVIKIQRRFRANKLCKQHKEEFELLKKAVRIVEVKYKAKKDMLQCKNEFVQTKAAAVVLQKRFRALILGREVRKYYKQLKVAVGNIESHYEAIVLMRNQRLEYLKIKKATVIIQRQFKAQKLMQQQRKQYLLMKDSVIKIQMFYRGFKSMQKCVIQKEKQLNAICKIQTWYRQKLQRKKAAICLQRKYRARLQMKIDKTNYEHLKKSVRIIQQHWRATLDMQTDRAKFRITRNSIVKIQQWYRSIILMRFKRNGYENLKRSVILIQRRFRAQLDMKHRRFEYLELKRNLIAIQNRFRANLQMKQDRREYLRLQNAVLVIQRRFRANIQCKIVRKEYLQIKNAVKVIETRILAKKQQEKATNEYLKLKRTTIFVQRTFRAKLLARQIYQKQKHAVSILENRYLAILQMRREKKNYLTTLKAIILIQRKFKAYKLMKLQRSQFLQLRNSAVKIQEYYRNFKEMQTLKQSRIIKLRTIFKLQTMVRGVLARRAFAKLNTPEAIAEIRLNRKRRSSATIIQAVWRGYKERSRHSQELEEIRIRSELANKAAKPENTIKNRTKRDISIIAGEKENPSMRQIISALEDLSKTTRISQESCISLAKKSICTDLYDQITNACHSLSDVIAASAVAGILLNIAKCKSTMHYAWLPCRLYELIKNMQRFCDKENDVFLKLATLLWVFGHNEEYKQVILEVANFSQSMMKMLVLCERQQKIVCKKQSKSKAVSVFAVYEDLALPNLRADCGLDYSHAPYTFCNSVHAIRSLCELFNL